MGLLKDIFPSSGSPGFPSLGTGEQSAPISMLSSCGADWLGACFVLYVPTELRLLCAIVGVSWRSLGSIPEEAMVT